MNAQSEIFLETSIQIDRFMRPDREAVVLYNLRGKQIHTSCYVLAEFRRTLLRDLWFLYSVVSDYWGSDGNELLSLEQLLHVLSRLGGVRSERRYQRFFWFAACLLDCFGDDPVLASDLLEWLDEHIAAYTYEFFLIDFHDSHGSAEVLYECQHGCDLVKDDRSLSKMTCSRHEACCLLPQFLAAREEQLQAIFSTLRHAPSSERDNKALAALERVLGDPTFKIAKGQGNCWPLGDTIIALEAPARVPIYTLDHHYDLLCSALGKIRYVEQVPPEML